MAAKPDRNRPGNRQNATPQGIPGETDDRQSIDAPTSPPGWLRQRPDGVAISVAARPGAPKNTIEGTHGDFLKVKVAAPPVDGAANEAIIRFLADVLSVRPSRVSIQSGHTARQKILLIEGVTTPEALRAFRAACPSLGV